MEVKCPNCSSRFNLADGVARSGTRLRCSVCKEIFRLEPPAVPDYDLDSAKALRMREVPRRASRKRGIFLLLAAIALACGSGGAAWWHFTRARVVSSQQESIEQNKRVEMLTMRNVRQYYVSNEKVGQVFVIEGKVVNEFPTPKDFIRVEAALYGADKKILVSKTQLAGTILSLFQLQVLGEKELEGFLQNKIEILTNNTNVPTGGEVPFMVLFYSPPPTVAEFGVKIIDAKDAESKP